MGLNIPQEEIEYLRSELLKFYDDTGFGYDAIAGGVGVGGTTIWNFINGKGLPSRRLIVRVKNFLDSCVKNKRGIYTGDRIVYDD